MILLLATMRIINMHILKIREFAKYEKRVLKIQLPLVFMPVGGIDQPQIHT